MKTTKYITQAEAAKALSEKYGLTQLTARRLIQKMNLKRVALSRKSVLYKRIDVNQAFREIEQPAEVAA